MLHPHKRIRILIEAFILVFLVILGIFIITVSSLDIERYRPLIMANLKASLGGDVSLGRLEFSLFPAFGVKGYDLAVVRRDLGLALTADDATLGVSPIRLMVGKLVPTKIRITAPEITVMIRGGEKIPEKILRLFELGPSVGEEPITLRDVKIIDATIIFEDLRGATNERFTLTIFSAAMHGNPSVGPVKFSLSLAPPGEEAMGRMKFSGTYDKKKGLIVAAYLKAIDVTLLFPFFGEGMPLDAEGVIWGELDITVHNAENWEASGDIRGNDVRIVISPPYPEGVFLDDVSLSGSVSSRYGVITTKRILLTRGRFRMELSGEVRELGRGRVGYFIDFVADISDFSIKKDITLIPFGLVVDEAEGDMKKLFVSGWIDALVRFRGDPSRIADAGNKLTVTGDVRDADLDFDFVIARGANADFNMNGDDITVSNVTFDYPKARIKKFTFRVEDVFTLPYMRDMVIEGYGIDFEGAKDILASDVIDAIAFVAPTEGAGTVRGVIDLDAPIGDTPGVADMTGRIDFSDWSLTVPFFVPTFIPTHATLIFEPGRMEIPPAEFVFKESTLRLDGELTRFENPLLVMSLKSTRLDLIELFGTGDKNLYLDNFSARLIFEEGYILLDNMKFSTYGGACFGKWGYIYTGEDEGTLFYINLEGEKVDVFGLLSDAGISEDITGSARITLDLKSEEGDPETILKTLDGKASVLISEGNIKKITVLSKIISIMNISNYLTLHLPKLGEEGIPFETITGDFALEDGVAKTENLFMKSRVMRVSAIGSVNLITGEIDMIMGFQILKTIDLIVNKIPVFGYILTGEDENLFTTYFKVTGTLEEPEVKSMNFRALGEGTLHIFDRIFSFPLKGLMPR